MLISKSPQAPAGAPSMCNPRARGRSRRKPNSRKPRAGAAYAARRAVRPRACCGHACPEQPGSGFRQDHPRLSDAFRCVPNPNSVRPATVAAIAIPTAICRARLLGPRRGGIHRNRRWNSIRFRTAVAATERASVGMPGFAPVSATPVYASAPRQSPLASEIISKPPTSHTRLKRVSRASRQCRARVTFLSSGQIVVGGVLKSLGYGLDQEAVRVAQQIRFHRCRQWQACGCNHPHHHHFSVGIALGSTLCQPHQKPAKS